MVNPQIPQKIELEQDQVEGKMYKEYEVWIMLPRVLSCKHTFELYTIFNGT